MITRYISTVAATLLISGCATAPVALEEANHGLSLTMELKQQLAIYDARQAVVDDLYRQGSDRTFAENQQYWEDQAQDKQLYEASGQVRRLAVMKQLDSGLALLRQATSDGAAGAARVQEQPGLADTPFVLVGETLDATGKAFGALGKELPFAQRAELAASFFREIRDEASKNQTAADRISAGIAREQQAANPPPTSTVK